MMSEVRECINEREKVNTIMQYGSTVYIRDHRGLHILTKKKDNRN